MTDQLKKTALHHIHHKLGAKMVEFAGFEMPVSYAGVNEEHINVRKNVGVFDVSHMGEFFIIGKEAENLLQKVTTNDVSKLYDGKAQYTCMPNYDNGIVDDFILYRFHSEKYMVVANASNIEKDYNWIVKHNEFDAKVDDRSDEYSLLAIQGPKAVEAMQSLYNADLNDTGSGGLEIYFKNQYAEKIWDAVMDAGKDFNIKPTGLAARDTLRLEMGLCLYGNDIDDTTSPIEARLGWITKFTKDFINAEQLKKQKEEGVNRKLTAFIVDGKAIPRHGYTIVDQDDKEIGYVTSGTRSPMLEQPIGLGYVKVGQHRVGDTFYIQIRKRKVPAQVVKLPFYKPEF
jgi:aminomethyltransferase